MAEPIDVEVEAAEAASFSMAVDEITAEATELAITSRAADGLDVKSEPLEAV